MTWRTHASPRSVVHSVSPPLVVTGDAALASELQRLAAAAGTALEVLSEVADARSRWQAAPVVLVGPDALASLAVAPPVRRGHVHVVSLQSPPGGVFRAALEIGAENVIELPGADAWLVETLTDATDGPVGSARVVTVVGGCGGAGATTFAAALAMAAASDVQPVTLLDADPLGSGIERIAGLDELEGSGWGSLLQSAGRLGSRSLRASLPQRGGLAVLGWGTGGRTDLDAQVVREVVSAARRGSTLVVADVPRYPDPAVSELLLRSDHLVVVCPLTLSAVASTVRMLGRVLPLVPDAHLVTRGPDTALDPADVSDALGLPLAATMVDQRRLDESVELGLGPLRSRRGPLARAVRSTLGRLDTPRLHAGAAA